MPGRSSLANIGHSCTSTRPSNTKATNASFTTEFDTAFAYRLMQEGISSRAITRLLSDMRLKPLHDQLSWRNPIELKFKMEMMGTNLAEAAGKWQKAEVAVGVRGSERAPRTHLLRHRCPLAAVRFLLGHHGFKDDLVYAPYRMVTKDDPPRRIYGEMASGDWWWKTQAAINVDGATVVPVIIASDKTQVTNH